jgi:hypothetical protein
MHLSEHVGAVAMLYPPYLEGGGGKRRHGCGEIVGYTIE